MAHRPMEALVWGWNVSLCYSAACPTSGSRPCSPVTPSGSHPNCILIVDHDYKHSRLVTLGPIFLWICKYIGAIDKPFAINRCVISHLTITLTLMHMVLKPPTDIFFILLHEMGDFTTPWRNRSLRPCCSCVCLALFRAQGRFTAGRLPA